MAVGKWCPTVIADAEDVAFPWLASNQPAAMANSTMHKLAKRFRFDLQELIAACGMAQSVRCCTRPLMPRRRQSFWIDP
jgi:hypothetical protein